MDVSFENFAKQLPLISVYTLFDMDVGLVLYVKDKFYDTDIFNIPDIDVTTLIAFMYYRPMENPLYPFLIDDTREKFIDECYSEFMEKKSDEIIHYAIRTDVFRLVEMFKNDSVITPTILYYTDKEKQILEQMPELGGVSLVSINDVVKDNYTQFYFMKFEEIERFSDVKYAGMYFASSGRNMIKLDEGLDNEYLMNAFKNHIQLNLFDVYSPENINKEIITWKED